MLYFAFVENSIIIHEIDYRWLNYYKQPKKELIALVIYKKIIKVYSSGQAFLHLNTSYSH